MNKTWFCTIYTFALGLIAALVSFALYIDFHYVPGIKIESYGGRNFSVSQLDDLIEDGLTLTFTHSSKSNVISNNTKYSANIIETNCYYPYVMGYNSTNTGFFTYEHQENGRLMASLNEKAAFDIFGSTDIVGLEFSYGGEIYTVCGCLYDGGEEVNIYIPVVNAADTIIIPLGEAYGVTYESALNKLNKIGINSDNYEIINTERMENVFAVKAKLGVMAFVATLILISAVKLFSLIKSYNALLSEKITHSYFPNIIVKEKSLVFKFVISIISVLALCLSGFLLFVTGAWFVMQWQAYAENAAYLAEYDIITTVILLTEIILFCAISIIYIRSESHVQTST